MISEFKTENVLHIVEVTGTTGFVEQREHFNINKHSLYVCKIGHNLKIIYSG